MKKLLLLLVTISMLGVFGCKEEEETVVTPTVTDPLVGVWVSEGLNVPFGLRYLKIKKIVATFNKDKSYSVVSTDSSNVTSTVTGTYANSESAYTDTLSASQTKGAKINTITANQNAPALTATGIYTVSGTKMAYEVIQSTPALPGPTLPPTAAGGFGSTTIAGAKNAFYIQNYVKQ